MPVVLAHQPLGILLHHIHADGPVNGRPPSGMSRLDRVVTVELFPRGGVGISIVVVNVIALLQPIIHWISPVSTVWMNVVRPMAGRVVLDTVARIQVTSIARIVSAIHPTMACPMMRRSRHQIAIRAGRQWARRAATTRAHHRMKMPRRRHGESDGGVIKICCRCRVAPVSGLRLRLEGVFRPLLRRLAWVAVLLGSDRLSFDSR